MVSRYGNTREGMTHLADCWLILVKEASPKSVSSIPPFLNFRAFFFNVTDILLLSKGKSIYNYYNNIFIKNSVL